jgi:hypothetical protein
MSDKEKLLNLVELLDDYAIKFLITFIEKMFIH